MSTPEAPTLAPTGTDPKLTSIFQCSAEFLGQLRLWLEMNPPAIGVKQILGYSQQFQVYDRATAAVDVANSVAETALYSKQINGGDMSTNRILRLTAVGDYLKNNAGADTITVRVKFGGTTFWSKIADMGGATGANRHPWVLTLQIGNLDSATSQVLFGEIDSERADEAAPATGIGNALEPQALNHGLFSAFGAATLGTVDTKAAQTLAVTVQWSAASPNNSWRQRFAMLELI